MEFMVETCDNDHPELDQLTFAAEVWRLARQTMGEKAATLFKSVQFSWSRYHNRTYPSLKFTLRFMGRLRPSESLVRTGAIGILVVTSHTETDGAEDSEQIGAATPEEAANAIIKGINEDAATRVASFMTGVVANLQSLVAATAPSETAAKQAPDSG
jgi:hypothetical protein